MKYNKLTNLAIFVLVAAAVFQTGELWLGNTDSHNFFYSLFPSTVSEINENDKSYEIIEPEKTVVGYGNRKFNMIYSDSGTSSVTALCEDVIEDVLTDGSFESVSQINWADYIEGKTVILKYSFNISALEFLRGYGVNNTEFLNNVKSVNYIVVAPGSGSSESTSCYFIDTSASEAYLFTLSGGESTTALYNAIQNMQYSGGTGLDYISTVQSGMNIFDSIYVPQWTDSEYSYNAVKVNNSFLAEDGEVDITSLGEYVNIFFDNYISGKDASKVNDVYTFSNDNVVVKYYSYGVLDYYNYDAGSSDSEQTIASAYTVSQNFINKDSYITNDVYLAGAETRNDGLVFYYDYAINNVPVVLSDEIAQETGMSHAIEIVVSNDGVKRYKRYVADIELDEENTAAINVDMISAWDDAIMNYSGTEDVTSVSDMYIGYYLNGEEDIYIKWFTLINGSTIVGETYR